MRLPSVPLGLRNPHQIHLARVSFFPATLSTSIRPIDGMRTLRVLALATVALGGIAIGQTQIVLKPTGEDGVKLRIRALKVDTKIDSQIATTNLTLTFQNPTQGNEEAEFIYALPPDTVVTSFAYYFNDERVPAKAAEKERAAAIYKHITTRRRDPALIEMTGKRTFRARIFPVAPTADLRVEMTLVQALPNRKGSFTYNLPLKRAKGEPFDDLDVTITAPKYPSENNLGLKPTLVAPVVEQYRLAGKKVRPDRDLRVRFKWRSAEAIERDMFSGRSGGRDGFFVLFLTPNEGRTLSGPVTFLGGRVYGVRTSANSARPGDSIIVTGRYREAGVATVRWGGAETYVTFSGEAVPNHPAVKLWAAREIEALGSKRKQVVALSMRHNLPSRFTSWIAIPIAERRQYYTDKLWEKSARLGQQYANALGADFEETPKSIGIRKRLEGVSRELGMDPKWTIQNALQSARLQITYKAAEEVLDGRSNGPVRARLQRLGRATGEDADELIRHRIQSEIGGLAFRYAEAVDLGRENTPTMRTVKARLKRAQSFGLPTDELVRDSLKRQLAMASSDSARKEYDEGRRSLADSRRVQRIANRLGESPKPYLEYAKNEIMANRVVAVRSQLGQFIMSGKSDAPEAERLREKLREMVPLVPRHFRANMSSADQAMYNLAASIARARFHNQADGEELAKLKALTDPYVIDPEDLILASLMSSATSHQYTLMYEESRSRLDEARIAKLREERDRYYALGVPSKPPFTPYYFYAAPDREWTVRGEFLEELRKPHPDPAKLAKLEKALANYSTYHRLIGPGSSFDDPKEAAKAYTEARLERLRTDVLLDKLEKETPSPAVEAERKRLEAKAQELRARMGDPLLTYDAPSDAQHVVAIMPDGEVKPMAWVPLRNRWEVRFDVPAAAKEGEVEVQIVAVLKDGRRQIATTTYHVDVTPPEGIAKLVSTPTGLRLELQGSADLARVTAVLPSGEEVDVPRQSEGRFMLTIHPLKKGDRVKFILLDRAHNRAEVVATAP